MSIWRSIPPTTDPIVFDAEDGADLMASGWFDVAVSMYGDRVRIILTDNATTTAISLDAAGIAELHRRVVIARASIEGGAS